MKIKKDNTKALIISVYFVQGIVSITGLALFLLTRNVFSFTWLQLSFLGALSTLTWCIKPLYGFLTDQVPIMGFRRKPYLILSSLLTFFGYCMLAMYGNGFISIVIASIILNVGLGFSDVIIDGFVVEKSTNATVGRYQSLCWRAKSFGILLASILSGILIERAVFSKLLGGSKITSLLGTLFPVSFSAQIIESVNLLDIRYILLFTSLLPFIVLFLSLQMNDTHVEIKENKKFSPQILISALIALFLTLLVAFWGLIPGKTTSSEAITSISIFIIWSVWICYYLLYLIKHKQANYTLFMAALFLFLWRFTPSFGAPWSDYFINNLSLSKEKLGYIGSLASLSWLIGTFIYNKFLDKLPLKKLLSWTVIIGVLLSFSQLIIASPNIANKIGNFYMIKYLAAILLYPFYFLGYHFEAWQELMNQPGILNLEALLSFLLEMMFILSFLPLLKLAALVTPKGVEATNFSVMASIMNLGLVFGSISGGWIYTYIEGQYAIAGLSFTGLHLTIIIGALSSLLCLPVLYKLKNIS
ncbi:MAG: hypothetical protein A2Y40_04880 [Candidatus Margulisbacteria bacterium GWF2_35_9]|nr:MAG: hypothetical protein A2Y40_04880 [Candidatus Margulisbacteria bacterium GWF2_35_9]